MARRRRTFVAIVAAAYAISLVNGFAAPRPMAAARRWFCDPASVSSNNNICRNSFFAPSLQHATMTSSLNNNSNNIDNETTLTTEQQQDNLTSIGSKEYYQGFITRSPDEEPIERVTGDAVLGPTLKFAGGVSLILVGLVLVFLVSNGLL